MNRPDRITISFSTLTASIVSALSMIAAVGWLSIPLFRGSLPAGRAQFVLTILTIAIGALTYLGMQAIVRRQMQPMDEVAALLRTASLRSRDQNSYVRKRLPTPDHRHVSELSSLVAALKQFTSRVEQRHSRQTAWIVAVVHDVKTPIAGAANAVDLVLRSTQLTDPIERELLSRISDELRVLVRDVQRMVDAVRFEREDVEVHQEEVDLFNLVSSIAERIETGRGVDVTVRGAGFVRGDRALLGRAIENLVANAVRYARSSVEIEVRHGLVRVADDGEGLPAPIDVLAQPFRSEPTTVGGVTVEGGAGGIGLFVTRRVLEMHGGRLVVETSTSHGTALLAYIGRLVDG